ncbi:CDP-diacylglycerol--serine O-phosphatidyltransferase [Novosphingobium sp. 1748]|nr:CDP-diacylglycerol--serine O-phosphatidyltransferase [Novosphingobium sp. 1748]
MSDGPVSGDERRQKRMPGGLTLRALAPNAITSAALCCGLTGIRFAIQGEWEKSVLAVILAGVLDGIDGRIARLLKAQSRFGAELDSLADAISFGVAPALIVFLWSLKDVPRLGWFAALAFAICMALRLARFNARIDLPDEPRKQAGFLTGVPAPVGAGLAFLPIYLWIASGGEASGDPIFRDPRIVGVWLAFNAFLLISAIPTLSWKSLRPRRSVRLELIALFGIVFAALLSEPWFTLVGICVVYLMLIPVGLVMYMRVRRPRGAKAYEVRGEAGE